MIYEFIGLPGAGKSYTADQVKTQNQLKEIKIFSIKERLARAIVFALRHPIFFLRLMFVFILENYTDIRLLKHKLSTVVLEIAAREQKAGNRNVLIETGFFQLLLSLYERKVNERDIAGFIRWLKKRPYMLYIIEARADVRNERMQQRGRVPRSGIIQNPEKLKEWFDISYAFAEVAFLVMWQLTHWLIA